MIFNFCIETTNNIYVCYKAIQSHYWMIKSHLKQRHFDQLENKKTNHDLWSVPTKVVVWCGGGGLILVVMFPNKLTWPIVYIKPLNIKDIDFVQNLEWTNFVLNDLPPSVWTKVVSVAHWCDIYNWFIQYPPQTPEQQQIWWRI